MTATLGLVGLAAVAFGALYRVATSTGRCGWASEVALPAALAIYTLVAVVEWPDGALATLLAIGAGLAAGVLLDHGAVLRRSEGELQGRRGAAPLLLWGAGLLLHVFGPTGATVEATGSAVSFAGALALLGQAARWGWRLLEAEQRPAREDRAVPPPARAWTIAGQRVTPARAASIAAVVAIWLGLPSVREAPAPGLLAPGEPVPTQPTPPAREGKRAPAKSLLVSTSGKLASATLQLLDLGTGSYRAIPIDGGDACWSPDGTRMAITRKTGNHMQLWVADADGSDPRQLTDLSGDAISPAWSGDGQRIYFVHGASFLQGGLWMVPISGGMPQQVLPPSQAVSFPTVSPDGKSLAYFRGADLSSGGGAPPQEIKLLDLATNQDRMLLSQPAADWTVTALAWTRDGQALVASFGSTTSGRPFQLEKIAVADARREPLGAAFSGRPRSLTWIGGGSSLVALVDKGEIWLVDPATGERRRVEAEPSVVPASIDASPGDEPVAVKTSGEGGSAPAPAPQPGGGAQPQGSPGLPPAPPLGSHRP